MGAKGQRAGTGQQIKSNQIKSDLIEVEVEVEVEVAFAFAAQRTQIRFSFTGHRAAMLKSEKNLLSTMGVHVRVFKCQIGDA